MAGYSSSPSTTSWSIDLKQFLIPAITYRTTGKERSETLDRFRLGVYRAVVTSKVLDEGIDVPDADVGSF